jgi:dUTP pyrophosphatase
MKMKVKKLFPDAKLPSKATPGSFCFDVFSMFEFTFRPRWKERIGTGLAFELPRGYALDIRPRSGLASKGLVILNSPGTLDSDYRGELLISFINLSNEEVIVYKGDRIAQIRVMQDIEAAMFGERIIWKEVEELSDTKRGKGGFGSTGR